MTSDDRVHEPRVDERACPDAEILSCFIDGELSGDRAAAVATHVSRCPECADVLSQLRLLDNQGGADTGAARGGCPDRETLTGYLLASLAAEEQHAVDAHVLTCDACVQVLASMHRQLRPSWKLDAPVPAAIVRRALTVARPHAGRSLSLVRPAQPSAGVPAYLRLPVLLPTAFAAGVAFFIAINAASLVPRAGVDHTRAAGVFTGHRRLTTGDALMRSEPRDTATVVGRVARGVAVEVHAEEREWVLVSLPTHEQGWVPLRAFE